MPRGKGHGAQRRFGLTVRVGEQLAAAIAGAAVVFDVAVRCAGRILGLYLCQGMPRGKGHGAQRRFDLSVRVGEQLAAAIAGAAVVFDVAVFCAGRILGLYLCQGMLRGNQHRFWQHTLHYSIVKNSICLTNTALPIQYVPLSIAGLRTSGVHRSQLALRSSLCIFHFSITIIYYFSADADGYIRSCHTPFRLIIISLHRTSQF